MTDQYAARHNPFVYFHSLLDSGACQQHVVPLNSSTLPVDLQSIATTPNYVWITPNLCDDGHDVPCKTPGSADSYIAENTFLQTWVPIITRSPAFQQDGLLIITFDETSLTGTSPSGVVIGYDGSACCNEPSGPNTTLPGFPPLAAPQYYNIPITGSVETAAAVKPARCSCRTSSNPEPSARRPTTTTSCCVRSKIISVCPTWDTRGYPGTYDFGSDVFGPTIARQQTVSL